MTTSTTSTAMIANIFQGLGDFLTSTLGGFLPWVLAIGSLFLVIGVIISLFKKGIKKII